MDEISYDFRCPHCHDVFSRAYVRTGNWERPKDTGADGDDIGHCPLCGGVINFDELIPDETDYYYLVPVMHCQCAALIELPYSPLPQADSDGRVLLRGEDPPTLPPAEWSATFGCIACGHISVYVGNQVTIETVLKLKEGRYQSGKCVYYARFPCGDRRCTFRESMYLDTRNKNATEALGLLRSGLFDGQVLSCGHPMKTIPATFYRIEPVMNRLW